MISEGLDSSFVADSLRVSHEDTDAGYGAGSASKSITRGGVSRSSWVCVASRCCLSFSRFLILWARRAVRSLPPLADEVLACSVRSMSSLAVMVDFGADVLVGGTVVDAAGLGGV